MIKELLVTNYLGESLTMKLESYSESSIAVLGLEGLDPPKAEINITQMANANGGQFNSARIPERNVIVYLKPMGIDIDETRRTVYKYFPLMKQVEMIVKSDGRDVKVIGIVESNPVNIFTENEICQVSILCPQPYLESPESTITTIAGIESKFQFPFMNNSLEENLIEFGEYQRNQGVNIHYEGDAEVGIKISVHTTGDVTGLGVINAKTDQILRIDTNKLPGGKLQAGDDLVVSTVKGNKYAELTRGGNTTNVINAVERPFQWIYLVKGDNVFSYTTASGNENVVLEIENKVLYEGI